MSVSCVRPSPQHCPGQRALPPGAGPQENLVLTGSGGGLDTAVGEHQGEAGLLASATWRPAPEGTESFVGFFLAGGE